MRSFDAKNPHNILTSQIIGAAIEVHKQLGAGMLESVYETCLVYELEQKGLQIEQQKAIALKYKELYFKKGYMIDVLVEKKVAVELKSVEKLLPVHEAQVLSYIRFANCEVGLLINFNVPILKKGIKRFVNKHS